MSAAIEVLFCEIADAVLAHRAEAHLDPVGGLLGEDGHLDARYAQGFVDQLLGEAGPVWNRSMSSAVR